MGILEMDFDVIVIGGGAAGFFSALAVKEKNPYLKVAILEKHAALLSKVRVSGGGRCNVTHHCFDPFQLILKYPRGSKELRGPFHHFQPKDTIAWFEKRGVLLKTEADGRMFPITDSSQTIIDCLINETKNLGVEIFLKQKIDSISKEGEMFKIGDFLAKKLILASGSSHDGHLWAKNFGHTIQPPVPSLFTFNVPTSPLKDLSGVSVADIELRIAGFKERGPLLITHFGFSGPAVLKLSAWGARALHDVGYKAELKINWLPGIDALKILVNVKNNFPAKFLSSENIFQLPKQLWKTFVFHNKRLNDISLGEIKTLAERLQNDTYLVDGKTTHKEEFVTCGGVTLKEVNFKTMESKVCSGLYFAGEILDIDGVTGGFNFQNAWTTGFIAGSSASQI